MTLASTACLGRISLTSRAFHTAFLPSTYSLDIARGDRPMPRMSGTTGVVAVASRALCGSAQQEQI